MKLIKVKNGLIEAENFFLVSNFGDFAGTTNVSRNSSNGKLKVISNNKIERKFNYNEFVIEVEKENFTDMAFDDYSMIYLGNDNHVFGIKDKKINNQNKYWKILKRDNYIQAYSGPDGINYTNVGGMEFNEPLTKQGFMKFNRDDFILNNYRIYDNAYLTIKNFPENTVCELYDSNDKLIKTRLFNSDMECKFFLDCNNLKGKLIFKDPKGSIIFNSDNMSFGYGDLWIMSQYDFEIRYLGNVVESYNAPLLKDLNEMISIKNVGTTNHTNVVIGTQTRSGDKIRLSMDGNTYTDTLTLNLAANEEKTFYVDICKNVNEHNFNVRDFQLLINE